MIVLKIIHLSPTSNEFGYHEHPVKTKFLCPNITNSDLIGLFPLLASDSDPDSDTDSYTMQILWERDPNLNLTQWKHALHNIM